MQHWEGGEAVKDAGMSNGGVCEKIVQGKMERQGSQRQRNIIRPAHLCSEKKHQDLWLKEILGNRLLAFWAVDDKTPPSSLWRKYGAEATFKDWKKEETYRNPISNEVGTLCKT